MKLADHFFSEDYADQPVTYAVDAESLAQITGEDADRAVEALAAAVRAEIMPGHRYDRLWARCVAWSKLGDEDEDVPPPSLPVLGLCVLAITMDDRGALYRPLRWLLDPSDLDEGQPPHFDYVRDMWEQLSHWLDEYLEGSRGWSTIEANDFFVHVGYARTQAAIRQSDRHLIYRFFQAIGLEPGEEVEGRELRRVLELWAQQRLPRTQRLLRLATEESLERTAESLLKKLASSWDGLVRQSGGRRSVALRLVLGLRPIGLHLVAPHHPDDPPDMAAVVDSTSITFRASKGRYEPCPVDIAIDANLLQDGPALESDVLFYPHEGQAAIPFRYDDTFAGWRSQDRLTFDDKHHLLVHSSARAQVEGWIARDGLDGKLDPAATQKLPPGWFLIRGFRLEGYPRNAPDCIADLVTRSGESLRFKLAGGLKVAGFLRTYLTGGAPTVEVPAGLFDRVVLSHGDESQELRAVGGVLELGALNLPEGEYTVRPPHGEASVAFTLCEGVKEAPLSGTGSIRLTGTCGGASGMWVEGGGVQRDVVVIKAPREGAAYLLGPAASDVCSVDEPHWLCQEAGLLSWANIDAWPPFVPAWALRPSGRAGRFIASPLSDLEPAAAAASSPWATLILASGLAEDAEESVRARWKRYVDAAGGA